MAAGEPARFELEIGDPPGGAARWVVGRRETLQVSLRQAGGVRFFEADEVLCVDAADGVAVEVPTEERAGARTITVTPLRAGPASFALKLASRDLVARKTLSSRPEKMPRLGGFPNERVRELLASSRDPYVFDESYRGKKKRNPPGPRVYQATCWAAPLDLSGIAWDSAQAGTAITRRHLVSAAHWGNHLPPAVVFETLDDCGNPLSVRVGLEVADAQAYPDFKIADPDWGSSHWVGIGHDVAIATTREPLPVGVAVYPLPRPIATELGEEQMIGRTAISATWSNDHKQPEPVGHRIVGLRALAWFGPSAVRFRAEPVLGESLYFPAVSGDSGHPVFFLDPWTDRLVLAATYTTGGGGSGPYYGSNTIQEKLHSAILQSPAPDERFELWDPESGSTTRFDGPATEIQPASISGGSHHDFRTGAE